MTSESSSTDLFFPPTQLLWNCTFLQFLFVLCFLALQGPLIHPEDYRKKKQQQQNFIVIGKPCTTQSI